MIEWWAHLKLAWRRPWCHGVWAGGLRWAYCCHQSHGEGKLCWQWAVWDGYCWEHNTSCWGNCEGTA